MVGDQQRKNDKADFKMFISAPFGNYIKHNNAVSVTGTWTLHPRGNRFWSVIKTLRWNSELQGWTNKLGLPNPGIEVGLQKTFPSDVLSIAEIDRGDFKKLYSIIPETQSIELNLSCPNIGKSLPWDSTEIFARTKEKRKWCICKVSPTVTPEDLEFLITKLGFTQIHASNTLPTQYGGLSGQSLIPYTLDIIRLIREEWPGVTVIAGGGVSDLAVVYEYLNEGANHVSLGSVCFNPFKLRKILHHYWI
jgi:dihydroorotate dehydrogenase